MGTPLIYLFFLKMTDISSLTPGFGSALLPQGSLPPGPRQPIPSRATSWPHRPCNPSPPGLLSNCHLEVTPAGICSPPPLLLLPWGQMSFQQQHQATAACPGVREGLGGGRTRWT